MFGRIVPPYSDHPPAMERLSQVFNALVEKGVIRDVNNGIGPAKTFTDHFYNKPQLIWEKLEKIIIARVEQK